MADTQTTLKNDASWPNFYDDQFGAFEEARRLIEEAAQLLEGAFIDYVDTKGSPEKLDPTGQLR